MIEDSYFLVINFGLRSIRAIVFDIDGNNLASEGYQLETRISGDEVEQDPDRWWQMTTNAIRSVQQDVESDKIKYITVTSSSCNLVCTDQQNQPTYPSLLVSDKRSTKEAEFLAKEQSFADILSHPNFSASPSYLPPKILWLKTNEPDVYDQTTMFGTSNSYLTSKFVGRHVTDNLDAEKLYYDRVDGYPSALSEQLGLTTDNLPEVVPVGTDIGVIDEEVADLVDLPTDARFIVTTYDALAAFWGSGATKEGEASNVCGTCSSLRVYTADIGDSQLGGSTLKAQHFTRPNVTVVGGSNSLEGGLLEWAKSNLYAGDTEDDDALFDEMEADAKTVPAGTNGLTFLPYLLGERAPFDDPDVRGMFFGLERNHGREEMVRSIFESIGFLTRHMIESIEEVGVSVDKLKISGGLTRRELACQIKADVTGKPVVLIDELENTALGCMVIMASTVDPEQSIEEFSNNIVSESRVYTPDTKKHELYSEKYELFRELYETNKRLFKKRAETLAQMDNYSEHKEQNL